MFKLLLSLTIIVVTPLLSYSQGFEYENLDWESKPTWKSMDTAQMKEQQVVTRYTEIIEFAYNAEYNNNLVEYFTLHKKVRVFSDDAIQRNNKVYIGMSRTLKLIDARARVITPDGKVVDFDKSNIKESDGGDGLGAYNYFAIDGVVNGSDIEFTYTALRIPEYDGVIFDVDYPGTTYDIGFTLVSPENLIFAVKSYNGMPEMELDESEKEKHKYTLQLDSLVEVPDEKYSARDRYLPSIVFKLDKNNFNGKANLISFGEITKQIFERYHPVLDKASTKKLAKIVEESKATLESSEEQKIRLYELYLKKNFAIIDGVPSKSIKDIVKDGYTSSAGMILMMIQGLEKMGIETEIVLTADRYDNFFDKDYENYSYLTQLMLYFPKIDKFLAPDEQGFRLGIVPASWTNQNGLFIRTKMLGELKAGIGKVKYIDPLPMSATHDDMEVEIDFSDFSAPVINFKRSLSGYSSIYFQGFYDMIDEDGRKELDGDLTKFADEKGEIIESKVTGVSQEDVGVNPMIYTGKLTATSLLEKAGNRYLLKVGQLIGPQAEMYGEKTRVLDIEHDHNMVYDRIIKFEIPQGYELSKLESLKIDEHYPAENPSIQFVSNYTLEGNVVTIHVVESYAQINFKSTEIDDFRRIINAAANFNKIVLFLIKKE